MAQLFDTKKNESIERTSFSKNNDVSPTMVVVVVVVVVVMVVHGSGGGGGGCVVEADVGGSGVGVVLTF